MKIVIQRVVLASVEIEKKIVSSIQEGVVVLVGITHGDTEANSVWLAKKVVNLRIFSDHEGKMNLSLLESKGEALIVSQFTLYVDCLEGRRPSFTQSAPPKTAEPLYLHFVEQIRSQGIKTETGIFGKEMKLSLVNNGPVTLVLEKH